MKMRKLILAVFVLVYFNANALEFVGVRVTDAILYQGAYDKSNPRILVTDVVKKNCGSWDTSGKWRTVTKANWGYYYNCKFQPQNTKAYLIVIYECWKGDDSNNLKVLTPKLLMRHFNLNFDIIPRMAYVKGGTSVSTTCPDPTLY